MWEYPSDCPEPQRAEYADISVQHTQGQYEMASCQYLGSPNTRQLGEYVAGAVWNGIHGWEIQQY